MTKFLKKRRDERRNITFFVIFKILFVPKEIV